MNLNTPQIAHLKSMLALHEKRARVQDELDAIDHELTKLQTQIGGGVSAPAVQAPAAKAPQKRGPRAKSGRSARGALKAKIFAALERAGAAGVKVAPLAAALGTKSANVYAWFHAAAKRYKGLINKIGSAHYRLDGKLTESAPAPAASKAPKAPKAAKPAKAPKAAKGGGMPRG